MTQRHTYKNIHVSGVDYYGKHMMLTCESCNENLLDIPTMGQFLKDLADAIDMIRYGEPLVARFGEGIEEGISAVQLITTSALTVHTNDQARDLYLDVFSCKWFDEQTVINHVNKIFAPKDITFQIVLRK
ncbi:MAG: S-adenosylmethionine decarboxylase [Alphaproteobacteria bacterium]|nr:S-adenosylmethionine decarboxylase [Alphaproteobacteria bacterium]